MIYLETSALVKLVRREAETDALRDWLATRTSTPWVASALIEVELPRALLRVNPELLSQMPAVIGRLGRYEIDEVVRAAAAAYPDPALRSLDAIHLATAHTVFGGQLAAFITYDNRLQDAAHSLNLPVFAPGQ
jgi:predicted nucleic acid-binding protein